MEGLRVGQKYYPVLKALDEQHCPITIHAKTIYNDGLHSPKLPLSQTVSKPSGPENSGTPLRDSDGSFAQPWKLVAAVCLILG